MSIALSRMILPIAAGILLMTCGSVGAAAVAGGKHQPRVTNGADVPETTVVAADRHLTNLRKTATSIVVLGADDLPGRR